MSNPKLKGAILEVVDNQLRNLNPSETKETYDRVISLGYPDEEVRRGTVVASEIFEIMKKKEPFDGERFVKRLNKLPKTPS